MRRFVVFTFGGMSGNPTIQLVTDDVAEADELHDEIAHNGIYDEGPDTVVETVSATAFSRRFPETWREFLRVEQGFRTGLRI